MVKTSQATICFTPSEVLFGLSSNNNTSIVTMSFEGSRPGQLVGEELLSKQPSEEEAKKKGQWQFWK
jgi:hypothetical protein